MKKVGVVLLLTLALCLTACGDENTTSKTEEQKKRDKVLIQLSDSGILVNGEEISEDTKADVYKANDIIFYLEGQGIAYGEGTGKDEHSQKEADAHTVVHITEPGTYEISGKMEAGQIFIDLGKDAEHDPKAVVNLILNNAEITCSVAPAILFYNVYECGDNDIEDASMEVDITKAGANLTVADGSENIVNGSYVAKIYKSVELNKDGTKVVDSQKLHKYDAAVYSKMSMNVFGDTGKLNIKAENEGLDTELHLKVHGGNLQIESGNDGINVNEEGVSVFEAAGGNITIRVSGESGEGDGIDSNGWLLINGGSVLTSSCATSMDAGVDADNGIYINGGTLIASGNMNAEIAGGEQKAITFIVNSGLEADKTYQVRDSSGNIVLEVTPKNANRMVVVSADVLKENENYSLWLDDTLISEL